MKKRLLISIAALMLMSGCTANSGANTEITEKYWKLTELMGSPIGKTQKEAHIILKEKDQRVIGTGGCNSFNGGYTLKEHNRIQFSRMASTMMACAEGMDTEYTLLRALEGADSYTITGETLVLHRARMAPFARFEAVYLQ